LDAKKPYVIVVGIYASEPAEAALEHALELASSHERSEIHAISETDAFQHGARDCKRPGGAAAMDTTRSELAWRLHQKLDDMYRSGRVDCRSRPPRIVTHLLRDLPAREIARLATVVEADLVVVGTRVRRGERYSWSPMAETLTQTVPCRVLVVQPPGVKAVA
jgi:nucleotide-binding universal stress UspA family protein